MATNKRLINAGGGSFPPISNSFNTVEWVGTGSNQSITGVGFNPDLIITKSLAAAPGANVFDVARGNYTLYLYLNNGQDNFSSVMDFTSANTDGFDLIGSSSSFNNSGVDYTAYCWKGGGPTISNTDGNYTTDVSANIEAGFSVVKYSSFNYANWTLGHGLDSAPEFMIAKSLGARDWTAWIKDSSGNLLRYKQWDNPAQSAGLSVNDTLITIGASSTDWNENYNTFVFYCWHSVPGYSSFSSYVGSGSAGNAVNLGFEPAFVMIKNSETTNNFLIFDNKRNPSNPRDIVVSPLNSDGSLPAGDNAINFTSNGFEFTSNGTSVNTSGQKYSYVAFANQF